jgi:hypothetical protein
MPKLRTPAAELQNRTIVANIKYGMEMSNVNPSELAVVMRTSPKTVYSRLKHPEEFRIRELRAISKKLHIPIEQLITGKPT